MKWSAKLGRFAGIDVRVHVTFLILLAYLAAVFWSDTGTATGVLTGLLLVVMLFACVLLHEYGHALTTSRYGIKTRNITLLPIGGVALLESMPRDPRAEIMVALAGPAVNLVIAAAAWTVRVLYSQQYGAVADGIFQTSLLPSLIAANLMLGLFNLLPAFPLDGGRVLRAALSLRMDRVRATRIAAGIGRALAVGLGILGLVSNPFLILIAGFIWIGASAETRAVRSAAPRPQ